MANKFQVRRFSCFDLNGYEFYPVCNYNRNSSDWVWVPDAFESVFEESGPFVKPEFDDNGSMIGYSFLERQKVPYELLVACVEEMISASHVTLEETGQENTLPPNIAELLNILNPPQVDDEFLVDSEDEDMEPSVEDDAPLDNSGEEVYPPFNTNTEQTV